MKTAKKTYPTLHHAGLFLSSLFKTIIKGLVAFFAIAHQLFELIQQHLEKPTKKRAQIDLIVS